MAENKSLNLGEGIEVMYGERLLVFFAPGRCTAVSLGQFLEGLGITLEECRQALAPRKGGAPADWHLHHSPGCGTNYRGCAPECPKDIYERTGEWRPLP